MGSVEQKEPGQMGETSVNESLVDEDLGSEENLAEHFQRISEQDVDANPTLPLLIEIVGNARHRSEFVSVTAFPFCIGRAYDNDLILSDDTVSSHHVVVDCVDGQVTVANVSNENGTEVNGTLIESPQAAAIPSAISIGRTHLKLVRVDTPVAPAKPLVRLSKVTELCSNLRVALVLLFTYLLGTIYVAFESKSLWLSSQEVIVGELLELLSPLALATLTGFVSHLLTHRWRFPLQLSIASLVFISQLVLAEVASFISYFFTSFVLAQNFNTLFSIVIFTGLLAWQLRAISHLPQRQTFWIGLAIVGSLYTILILQQEVSQPDFISQPQMHTVLRVNDIRVANSIEDIAEFRMLVEGELTQAMAEQD